MHDELDLSILDTGSKAHVVALARRDRDVAIEKLSCEAVSELTQFRQHIDRAIRGELKRPTPDELTDFGRKLFGFLVRGGIKVLYDRLPPGHVRIHILSNRPDLQALPWEYFQEPGRAAGPQVDRSVVRIVPTVGTPTPEPVSLRGKVRVLFVSADPPGLAPVGWPAVKEMIERTFHQFVVANMPQGIEFDFEAIEGANRMLLRTALQQKSYDVLHFSGHGEVNGGVGNLILSRGDAPDRLSAEELCTILRGRNLRLVVLSSCETAVGDFSQNSAVIAQALVRDGVPAVVASQFALPNATVAQFVGPLYASLLAAADPRFVGDIDRAVGEGRVALATDLATPTRAALEWGIPVLYRQLGANKVFQS